MSVFDLIPTAWRPLVFVLLAGLIASLGAAGAWAVQAWRYEAQLAEQVTAAALDAGQRDRDALNAFNAVNEQRLALEHRLKEKDEAHFKELSGVQQNQKILSSRLATSELRLSVLLASPGSAGDEVSARSGTGGVVHAGARAELDPAHAQRIVAITGDGDEGLIALAACQAYVKEISNSDQPP